VKQGAQNLHGTQVTFRGLFNRHVIVKIPIIQRDYAQGRDSEREIRDSFLSALYGALSLPAGDERLPLNLDFIYGTMEDGNDKSFLPLDGQQRLTTLFLLHWYLAWRDEQLPQFRNLLWNGKHSRFSYQVRPSGTEFFDALVKKFKLDSETGDVLSVRRLIEDQPWFFRYWRLDPTIQSALTMLDAIHERFCETTGLYARLVDEAHPVITFQLLQLEHFGLTDDLYIKMNARGKPLTVFETFKARFEEHLKTLYPTEHRQIDGGNVSVPMFFAMRMDTRWTYFFWSQKDKESDTFDDAAINLLRAIVRVSLDPDSPSFAQDTMELRSRYFEVSFTSFHEPGWLTRTFADRLICLLEAWSSGGSGFTRQLPSDRYFDELKVFQAMETLSAQVSTPRPPAKRLASIYVPNGIHMQDWTPAAAGTDYSLPHILEPLAPFKQQITVVSGLAAHRADGPSGNHARALAVYLTGQRPPDSGREIQLGVSADQVAAARIGRGTRFPSLQIGCETAPQAGQCDNPYSCVYTSCISWSSPTTPLPAASNPRALFDRLFPVEMHGASRVPLQQNRLSILDFVREEAAQLRPQLGMADRRRIDEYLTSVREVELAIRLLPSGSTEAMSRPPEPPPDQRARIRLMCDLLVLAWQTDSTRIATLLFANEFSNRPYPFLEVRDGHHDLSHHGNDPEKFAKLRIINRFHVEQLAYLLGRLQMVREGEGTLLDHSILAYGCGNSDGNRHNHDNLPVLLAGRGAGSLRPGRHVRLARELPLSNLWVSLLERMGAQVDSFGDSTGTLPGLDG